MQIDAQAAAPMLEGQAGVVTRWKAIEYLGLALYIVLVPRLMGPAAYGAFALLISLTQLFMMATGLGSLTTFGRFTPEYAARGDRPAVRQLFMQILLVRSLVAAILAVVFVVLFPILLREASLATATAGAGALLVSVMTAPCYQLFYGLNRLGRWLVNTSLKKPVLISLLAALGAWTSLERASLALLLSEVAFLVLGVVWARQHFSFGSAVLRGDSLVKHLRFGLFFFLINTLMVAIWRAGEVMVKLFYGGTEEVAFFSVAASIVAAVSALITSLGMMIVPSMMTLSVTGDQERLESFVSYSLKYLSLLALLSVVAVYALGTWGMATAVGSAYLPAVANLEVLALAIVPQAFAHTAISLAVVRGEPRRALLIAAGALVAFVVSSALLVPAYGSLGASVAMGLSMLAAAVIAYQQFSMARLMARARFWRLLLPGLASWAIMETPVAQDTKVRLVVLLAFVVSLIATRAVEPREVRRILRAVIRR